MAKAGNSITALQARVNALLKERDDFHRSNQQRSLQGQGAQTQLDAAKAEITKLNDTVGLEEQESQSERGSRRANKAEDRIRELTLQLQTPASGPNSRPDRRSIAYSLPQQATPHVADHADVEELIERKSLANGDENRVAADLPHERRIAVVNLAAQVPQDSPNGKEPLQHGYVDLPPDFVDPFRIVPPIRPQGAVAQYLIESRTGERHDLANIDPSNKPPFVEDALQCGEVLLQRLSVSPAKPRRMLIPGSNA